MTRPSKAVRLIALLASLWAFQPPAALAQESEDGRVLSDVEMFLVGADANRLDVILHLLKKGVDVNARGKNGYTALMVAAGKGSLDVIELLLVRGAKVDVASDGGWTALTEAIRHGQEATVARLVRAGADIDFREERYGLTPLMVAAKADKPEIVALLVAKGADVNAVERKRGLTALHLALASDALKATEIAAELLVNGADPGKAASDGFTPLMAAVRSGKLPRVTLILSEKSDIDAETGDGRSALSLAAGLGHAALVRRLLDAGAEIAPGAGATTPLAEAIRAGSEETAKVLIERKADPEEPGGDGRTPLILAAQGSNLEIIRLLLDAGADVNGRNPVDGTTALMWAANTGRKSIVDLLVARGADAGIAAKDGWTAGEAARMAGHVDLARELERRI